VIRGIRHPICAEDLDTSDDDSFKAGKVDPMLEDDAAEKSDGVRSEMSSDDSAEPHGHQVELEYVVSLFFHCLILSCSTTPCYPLPQNCIFRVTK
jgi:hypothetical protein